MTPQLFTHKDISWLHFNHRVLEEAANDKVPLLERIKFLSIFSSNLDEFYRVKVPPMLALLKINKQDGGIFEEINTIVMASQKRFGAILDGMIIPQLKKLNIFFLNTEPIPDKLSSRVRELFFTEIAGLLHPVLCKQADHFFAENNHLYILVVLQNNEGKEELGIVNIPTTVLPRFFTIVDGDERYIVFLDDIMRFNLHVIFPYHQIQSAFNIKITRDAELNLADEYNDDIAIKIEKQLHKRDFGLATRFLFQPGIPDKCWPEIMTKFNLHKSSLVAGGVHHGLKDLAGFPVKDDTLSYPVWNPMPIQLSQPILFSEMAVQDMMVHTPYHHYNTVLRFFNEAAIDPTVEEIFTTLYRVASDSRIAHALISAARNGKKVSVIVELKARFDEANNLRWSKRMKEAGVKIIYSSQNIKVHAKIALVIRNHTSHPYLGLLATGNLNEGTAKYYTDHILLTSNVPILVELKMLFDFLVKKQKPDLADYLNFKHLLVAQFNLHKKFLSLIQREITHANNGKPSGITIKLNNLEEEKLISKLYKASGAGVPVKLIVRGICCLKPQVPGLSENIQVKRIVDRYLEHGRVFIFENDGKPEVYMGSSDWMVRNIYRRIEVCFPILQANLKKELMDILEIQWNDNTQAVWLDAAGENQPVDKIGKSVRSQEAIYRYVGGNL